MGGGKEIGKEKNTEKRKWESGKKERTTERKCKNEEMRREARKGEIE